MSQHFLLTAAARTLSLSVVARMSDEEAHDTFKRLRWADTDGEPVCPTCGSLNAYAYACRPVWRCKGCGRQFSLTSGTLFHSRKMPVRSYLLAIAIFANGAKGHAALHLSRDLDCQYKTAFVLSHKLREAMGSEVHGPDQHELAGTVAIDGAYFGGKVKQANRKADRTDRRAAEEQTGKRQVVVVARESLGRTLPFIVARESAAVPLIRQHVASGTIVHADESGAWDALHASYPMLRVNHSREFRADDGACTNEAESWFSRLRRAEFGIHHRISGKYLYQYADEMAWREDHRREPNGLHFRRVTGAALRHPKSEVWRGYWQRSAA
ncbi:MAG TPA: IS1595 family transposase [Stellaceae bacterium]|nr:IS1595 family transposase [Stellaceae bacterium]